MDGSRRLAIALSQQPTLRKKEAYRGHFDPLFVRLPGGLPEPVR